MSDSIQDAELLYLDQQLCFRLYTASRLVIRAYQPLLRELDITYPQYLVLMLMWEWRDKDQSSGTVGQLGKRLQLDSGTLTPLLKRMESRGLVQRRRGEDDERERHIELTDKAIVMRKQASDWMRLAKESGKAGGIDLESLSRNLDLLVESFS
ncbi:MarR family winged helix-turn-helix transcriptional regulator [Pseudoteredinibacter isoporae]|uniref:DNA-binding MarR family transcriptional regulator n=1 Tax=Pseudoteredinibacter isoporae TaxID=570281 RepID=A0A7X0JW73_9GAMM|nr:MarR family transcriptional regulator [Pseudoteredinibacter isoporae]MBB6522929.1 DNA-binding MarR family transcriptional regulator [Pseudoteredinibacter isoporae]NHO88455.1 MarR family transcriptional regulator [Pseudoteredinibacter isoporae]NIB23214.1 MarR family transcriptional regulator [Pseudoteredinibacter isoporae]